MKKIIIILFLFILEVSARDIQTAFSRYSSNGVIDIPTADILPHGNFCFDSALNLEQKEQYSKENGMTYSLSIGLYDYVQFNVSHYQKHYIALNCACRILKEDKRYYWPGLAIGVENIGGTDRFDTIEEEWFQHQYLRNDNYVINFEKNTLFLVMSKKFTFGKQFIRGHVGYGVPNGRFTGFGPQNWFLKNVFFSVEYSPIYNLRLIWEQDARDWNIGAIYKINKMFSIFGALTEFEHMDDWVGASFHVGFSMTLVPNFLEIKQKRKQYNQLIQSRIEEAERLDKLYQELVRKRVLLENRYTTIRLNIDKILQDHKHSDRLFLHERELINESQYYIKLGLEFQYVNEYDKAENYFSKAITIYPKNPIAYLRYGELYIKQNDPDKALEIWKNGLLKVPNDQMLIEAIQRYTNK